MKETDGCFHFACDIIHMAHLGFVVCFFVLKGRGEGGEERGRGGEGGREASKQQEGT